MTLTPPPSGCETGPLRGFLLTYLTFKIPSVTKSVKKADGRSGLCFYGTIAGHVKEDEKYFSSVVVSTELLKKVFGKTIPRLFYIMLALTYR